MVSLLSRQFFSERATEKPKSAWTDLCTHTFWSKKISVSGMHKMFYDPLQLQIIYYCIQSVFVADIAHSLKNDVYVPHVLLAAAVTSTEGHFQRWLNILSIFDWNI